jgi:Mg-chelatase subunit ChlD
MFARFSRSIATACLLVTFAAVATARASDDEYSIRTTVDEVRLTLVATDQQHRYVNNLAPSEIAIVDNEVIVRKFRSFSRAPEVRLNVVILIDVSGSITDRRQLETAAVLESIRNANWSPLDTVSVLAFGSGTRRLTCIKSCPAEPHVLPSLPSSGVGLTPLYDSVVYAANILSQTRTPDSKSILIVFSDGQDNYSARSLLDAVDSLQRIDATTYSVDLNTRRSYSNGTSALQRLAGVTGGLTLPIDDGPAPILDSILNDLHSAYILTYVPPVHSLGAHAVQVLPTRNLNLKFRSRQGYIYNRVSEEARASQ